MKKILIVDDNSLIVEIMSYILANKGYEVEALDNGDEVLDHIRTNQPDLLILDDDLPGMTGSEICKVMKSDEALKRLPVIMCSANDCIDAVLQQAGSPNDVLQKPFDIDALIGKVELQLAA